MNGYDNKIVKHSYYKQQNNMKKVLFAALLMITSTAVFAQHQEPKFEKKQKIELRKQFAQNHQRPQFGPHHFPMHPKPERIIVKGNKVIVIFDRKDFAKLKPMVVNRDRMMFRERPKTKFHQMLETKMAY